MGVLVFLDHRPLFSALDLRPLGPRPPKYWKNKFMDKAYYLFKIILMQYQNIILIQDIQKAI